MVRMKNDFSLFDFLGFFFLLFLQGASINSLLRKDKNYKSHFKKIHFSPVTFKCQKSEMLHVTYPALNQPCHGPDRIKCPVCLRLSRLRHHTITTQPRQPVGRCVWGWGEEVRLAHPFVSLCHTTL